MYRVGIVAALLAFGAAETMHPRSVAWPLRATITDPRGRSLVFRAVTLGGDLVVSRSPDGMVVQPLAYGDTLSATTPASFPLDLKRGPVEFFTTNRDSVRVAVGWNPGGDIRPVTAQGRQLTVRLVRHSVVIDAR